MVETSLKNKTISGVGWSAAEAFLSQGVTFIVGLVLARLLSPEEYGLIGIVTIFTVVMMGIVDSGFSNSLIRKQDVSDSDYNTLFIFNLIVSIVLYSLLFFAAPWISRFFVRPELILLVRIMGLILVFQAISIVQHTILSRRLDFKTKTKAAVISAVCSGVIGISMALLDYGVWSLVGQQLSRQLIFSLCLWGINKWIPQFKIRYESLRYMWGFGWKLLVSGLLDNIWKQLYQVVVGKFYSPATLGQYARSEEYANLLSLNITSMIQRVSYPALAQIQDDKLRLKNGYRKVVKCTMFVTSIAMISMAAVSEPLVYCLIGPQWKEASTYLPLICISFSLYPLHAINLNMLQIQNRTDIFLYLEIIKKTIAIIPIVIGILFNIYWMLIGSIVIGIISFFLNSFYSGKSLGYTSWDQLKDVAPGYSLAMVVAIAVYFFKFLPCSYWIILPIQVVIGISVFFIICENKKMEEYLELKTIGIRYLSKLINRSNNG